MWHGGTLLGEAATAVASMRQGLFADILLHLSGFTMNENPAIHEIMRRRRVKAMVADADFLRSQSHSQEREDAIQREIRQAMLQYALKEITEDERQVLFNLLCRE